MLWYTRLLLKAQLSYTKAKTKQNHGENLQKLSRVENFFRLWRQFSPYLYMIVVLGSLACSAQVWGPKLVSALVKVGSLEMLVRVGDPRKSVPWATVHFWSGKIPFNYIWILARWWFVHQNCRGTTFPNIFITQLMFSLPINCELYIFMILTYKIYSISHHSYCCYIIRENKKCKLLLEKAIF